MDNRHGKSDGYTGVLKFSSPIRATHEVACERPCDGRNPKRSVDPDEVLHPTWDDVLILGFRF